MSVSIYVWGTTPANPNTLPYAGNDFTQYVPFSTAPNGQQSRITVDEVIPGTGTCHMELWDLTNQIVFAELAPIWVVDNTSGANIFTGIVQKVKATPVATYRLWTVDCVDRNWLTDTTLVGVPDGSSWEVTDTSTGNVATNVDPNATTSSPVQLFSRYWQYGVGTIDTTTYVDTTLFPTAQPTFDRVTLRNALDQLAGGGGPLVTWWLDQGTGTGSSTKVYLHWTNFANVTNVGVLGVGTIIESYGWLGGGPLTMLFPFGLPNAVPAGGTYSAPYALTDTTPDYTTTWDYENFSLETDYTGYRASIYVRGGTDYTYSSGKVTTGGSGWVGDSGDGGSSYLSDFYDQPNATNHAERNALGGAALRAMQVPLVRGTADLILDPARGSGVKLFHAGQSVSITSNPLGIFNGNFFIMRASTSFLSGTGVRRVALQWGTAAKLNMALRAQARAKAKVAPKKGATVHSPSAGAQTLAAGGSTIVSSQLVNSNGDPWPIAGKTVTWSCQVLNSSGTDVTSTTSFTLNPTSSTTDASGKASTTLTTDPAGTVLDYLVTAVTVP